MLLDGDAGGSWRWRTRALKIFQAMSRRNFFFELIATAADAAISSMYSTGGKSMTAGKL